MFVPRRWVSELPAELASAVRELARRNGATLFKCTLLAAFQVTLSRWTGEDDLVVGTPVANRTRPDVRETMGYFSGVVPLRGQVDRDRPFNDYAKAVHQTTVDSFANAMPFAELVKALDEQPPLAHPKSYFPGPLCLTKSPRSGCRDPRIVTQAPDALDRDPAIRSWMRNN